MRGLVTGGAGFIGSELCRLLLDRGWEVRALDNLDSRVHGPGPPSVPEGAELIRGSLLSRHARLRALEGRPDIIFHQAAMCGLGRGAKDAREYLSTNVLGTLDLLNDALEASHRVRRVVLASSMAIYGEGAYECQACARARPAHRTEADLAAGRWEPRCPECDSELVPRPTGESQPTVPSTVYARSKWFQEELALALARDRHLPLIALRYQNVYGPGLPRDTPYAAVASIFRSCLARGLAPDVFEDGRQLRDFIHVSDVAWANLLAADAPEESVAFEPFNIGTGRPRSIWDLAVALMRVLAPGERPLLSGKFRSGDARHIFASTLRARARLGFEARIPWEEGIRRFAKEPMRAPAGVVAA